MRVIQSLKDLDENSFIGLTIGNFDGVHLGHRQLLSKIKSECTDRKLKFVVLTFVPHPQKILQPDKKHFLINSYFERRKYLEALGVDILVELPFTRDFSTLSPEDFLKHHLLGIDKLSKLYLGYDFAFGANKQGSFDLVQEHCSPRDIEVEVQPKYKYINEIVSSTSIRQKVCSGDVEGAEVYLGRPFSLEGVVVKGEGRGRKIGFPTANIQISSDLIIPHRGVYITRTKYAGMNYNSVTNIGFNPTFKDESLINIETNVFDFDSYIYGENIHVEFLKKIRDEKKFSTVNDLIDQIRNDVESAKIFLKRK